MKANRCSGGMVMTAILTVAFLGMSFAASAGQSPEQEHKVVTPRSAKNTHQGKGHYLVTIAGCNDCHTKGWGQAGGALPPSDWLAGDPVGWRGPWGTTYAVNLRLFVQNISEDSWVKMSRTIQARPPMPWWVLHEMKDQDIRAVYRYIKSLGPKGESMPVYVPPDQEPKTPYILFVPQQPK